MKGRWIVREVIRFEYENDEGEECEGELPARFEVCHRCEGRGNHVNPSIDGNGITSSERAEWDEDDRETYLAGGYDVTCEACAGRNVVLVVDEDAIEHGSAELKAEFKAYCEVQDSPRGVAGHLRGRAAAWEHKVKGGRHLECVGKMPDTDDTKFYAYEGNPAYWRGGDLMRVHPDGSETRIGEIAKFMLAATPVTREEFNRATGRQDAAPKNARELMILASAEDLDADKFADEAADAVVDLMNAELKKRGEPPLA